jgi:hypothetical protein
MKEVVIAGYLRTGQSHSKPSEPLRDWLGNLRADDMMPFGLLIRSSRRAWPYLMKPLHRFSGRF